MLCQKHHNQCTNLCVIPARGGSSRFKLKNIQSLWGKPLLGWAIEAAQDSGVFNKIVVSTDHDIIADIATSYKVDVQWRPSELATNTSLVKDTMQYVVKALPDKYDYVQLLEATNPLVFHDDIRGAMHQIHRSNADFIVSVCPVDPHIPLGFASPLPESGGLHEWFPEYLRCQRTQDVELGYHLDGNIYIGKDYIWREKIDYWTTDIIAYKMPNEKYCHIDTEGDLVLAENIMQRLLNERRQVSKDIRNYVQR